MDEDEQEVIQDELHARLLRPDQEKVLLDALAEAYQTLDNLRDWLTSHLPLALQQLAPGNLRSWLVDLARWGNAQDGMRALLQKFYDHPFDPTIRPTIAALAPGSIRRHHHEGVAHLPPLQRPFVTNRPFVNRRNLRRQIQDLADSEGAKRILVIEGGRRSGKSFAMSMALESRQAGRLQWLININDYAGRSAGLNAREFAVAMARHEEGCPRFDITKEDEAVPGLMLWLSGQLMDSKTWIIIDHCDRRFMTRGARSLLKLLVERLDRGDLGGVRLVLVDFDPRELSPEIQRRIRHDRAELPRAEHVEEWCLQVAALENRDIGAADAVRWAAAVFDGLDRLSQHDGSWQMEFESRLLDLLAAIRACKERA